MYKIKSLSQSPCYHCPVEKDCERKCKKNPAFYDIVDMVFGDYNFNREECPLYIAITAKVEDNG